MYSQQTGGKIRPHFFSNCIISKFIEGNFSAWKERVSDCMDKQSLSSWNFTFWKHIEKMANTGKKRIYLFKEQTGLTFISDSAFP